MKLEKERRFLIKLPLADMVQETIKEAMPVDIIQTYLIPDEGSKNIERVRCATAKIWKTSFKHYFHTKKTYVDVGMNEEIENDLKEDAYELFLKAADPDRIPIEKTRYMLSWGGKDFELDIFHDANIGLAILEIELEDMKEVFTLPTYLEVIKEITGDDAYSNYNLARKK